jgi:hypothetical protein
MKRSIYFCIPLLTTILLTVCLNSIQGQHLKEKDIKIEIPTIVGEWQHIFNPNHTRSQSDTDTAWYTNDHCFVIGPDGKWHAYGIIGNKTFQPWLYEQQLFHISADQFDQSRWEDHGNALEAIPGVEFVLYAPHVYHEKGSDVWHMFYNILNLQNQELKAPRWGNLCRADSRNMYVWERHELNPIFSDPGDARDSYILKVDDMYYFYYTRTFSEIDSRCCVAVRTSPDLKHWSGPRIVHIQPRVNHWAGDTESPYVVERNGIYYLFICLALTDYNLTKVYWSEDPGNFPIENFVCDLPTHASEIIEVSEDEWYISDTGWKKKGIYIAKMIWK